MYLDYSLSMVMPSAIQFPEYAFPDPPKDPADIKQTITMLGTQTGVSTSLGGTADDNS